METAIPAIPISTVSTAAFWYSGMYFAMNSQSIPLSPSLLPGSWVRKSRTNTVLYTTMNPDVFHKKLWNILNPWSSSALLWNRYKILWMYFQQKWIINSGFWLLQIVSRIYTSIIFWKKLSPNGWRKYSNITEYWTAKYALELENSAAIPSLFHENHLDYLWYTSHLPSEFHGLRYNINGFKSQI